MLRVTLDDYLHLAMSHRIYYHIRQAGLRQRMKVYFRLFQQNRGAFRHVMQQHDHRQHLGYTESHVGEHDFRTAGGANLRLPSVRSLGNFDNPKRVDKLQFAQPVSDDVGKRQQASPPPGVLLLACVLCRDNCVYRPLAPRTHVPGTRTRPKIISFRVVAQRTQVINFVERSLERRLQIGEKTAVREVSARLIGKAVGHNRSRQRPTPSSRALERKAPVRSIGQEIEVGIVFIVPFQTKFCVAKTMGQRPASKCPLVNLQPCAYCAVRGRFVCAIDQAHQRLVFKTVEVLEFEIERHSEFRIMRMDHVLGGTEFNQPSIQIQGRRAIAGLASLLQKQQELYEAGFPRGIRAEQAGNSTEFYVGFRPALEVVYFQPLQHG